MNNINQNLITLKGGTYLIKYSSLPAKLVKKAESLFDNNDLTNTLRILDLVYWKLYKKNLLGCTWHFSKNYKRKVGSNSTHLWNSLVKSEILVCNGSYHTKQGKSKKYGINSDLLEGDNIQITYREHVSSSKKIELYSYGVLSELDLNVKDVNAIINTEFPSILHEVRGNTHINEDGSLTYDNGKKRRKVPKPSSMTPGEHFESFVALQSKEVCKAHQRALEALISKSYGFPKRNNTNYRLNHVLTNLPSRYLSQCTIEGEELIEIDLKNSQFTLLANLIKNPSLLYRWGNTIFNSTVPENSLPLEASFRLLHNFQDKADIQLFQEYCYQGVLYEEICKVLHGKETTSGRDKVKSLMFALVFKEIQHMPKAELYDAFNENFANVIELIIQLKRNFVNDFKEMDQKEFMRNINKSGNVPRQKGAMNFLAILLQRIEAKIFIDEILDTLRISGIKAISRHDSILVKKSHEAQAYSIVESRLSEILGEGCFSLNSKN